MKRLLLLFLAPFVFLTACQQADLHHNLQELEADEILVILHQNGIEAKKEKEVSGQEISWKVLVTKKDAASARQILIANNFPRRRELGLSGVYKEKGLIPTPDEQKARFLLALKGEIINSLQGIPGVVAADIVLNIPSENEFVELDPVKKRPTASIVVKTRNEAIVTQTVTEAKIQRFVANAVPNLDPNDVTVIVTRIESGVLPAAPVAPGLPPPSLAQEGDEEVLESLPLEGSFDRVAGVQLHPDSVGKFKFYLISLLVVLASVSAFLLVNIIRLNRLRLRVQRAGRSGQTNLPSAAQANLLQEGASTGAGMEGTFDIGAGQPRSGL